MRVGFFQFRPGFGRVRKNLAQVIHYLRETSADLIVLPELIFTGYYFKDREELMALAESPQSSQTVESLQALCRERDFYLVTGFAEKDGDRYFNSALLIGPEGLIYTYRKLHLFNEEKKWFDPGDTPLEIQQVRGVRIGIMICFDWIFPEVTRILAIQGAEIICHPSNLVLSYCQQTMLSRCLENCVFAITANRCGADTRPHGSLRFTGRSQIVTPRGDLLYRAPAQRTLLYLTEIDSEQARNKKITPLNNIIEDRRPEFYAPLSAPQVISRD